MGKDAGWDDAAVAEAMHVLADRTRLRILLLLGEGEVNVSELSERLGAPQPSVSHHLGILRVHGAVVARRSGKQVFYKLAVDAPEPRIIHVAAGTASVSVQWRSH